MKKIIYTSLVSVALLVGCQKDEDKAVLSSDAVVSTTISASTLTLEETEATQTALTITWETKNVNLNVVQKQSIVFAANGKEKLVAVDTSPYSISVGDLNAIVVNDLGLVAGQQGVVNVSVRNTLGNKYALPTNTQELKVIPYLTAIAPTEWGVVGELTGWGSSADISFWKTSTSGVYAAYVNLTANKDFKIRKGAAWDKGGNLGAKEDSDKEIVLGTEKVLYNDGGSKNLFVTETGAYRISFTESKLSIIVEKYGWSIIGDAANGWNPGNDIALTYDGTTDTWVATNVSLKAGKDIKFRFNNDWAVSYGDKTMDGKLDTESDNNIKITEAGTYDVIVSITDKTYKLVKK
ncbi:MAG: SusF/SusE family outer membrane protein [Capnocytophaga sp.]|nr:SusF/SusE family outer membrane protein [Capnocytophaga sp.]